MISTDLHLIAAQLEGLEETIIHKLIDRAQFKTNKPVYCAGQSGFDGAAHESLFDLRLRMHEEMDARFGRFCVPEERPFIANLPEPGRKVVLPQTVLAVDNFETVNCTKQIKQQYLQLVPRLAADGDDGHYGSSAEHDVYALQSIARRIHYGALYVAESKFRASPESYKAAARRGDVDELNAMLTRKEVEERIYERVADKVSHLQSGVNRAIRTIIDPAVVLDFYRECIIPLTKQGEIKYLLARRSD